MSRFRNIPAFKRGLPAAAAICLGAIAFGCLTPASAQAAQWCHTEVGPVGPKGEPGEEFYHCENQPAAAPYRYAAIAVSGYSFSNPSIAWGTTVWAGSKIEAEREALGTCRAYGGRDCKVVAWGGNRCLALALSADNASGDNAWAPGIGNYPETAQANALAKCRANGGKSCAIKAHPCSEDY
jgi:hypothetical protein